MTSPDTPIIPSPIPDALVAEILAGCEGVTNGPWRSRKAGDRFSVEDYATRHVALLQHAQLNREMDAAHIARLDPATVHSILTRLQYLESLDRWQPIETAPAGHITEDAACRGTSDWFVGRVAEQFRRIGAAPVVVIRRRAWPQEDSWECNGDAHYIPNYFDAWAPLRAITPTPPSAGVQS